jgi:hypothetical protein
MAKDLFSEQSEAYAKYRPGYAAELFEYIFGFVQGRNAAWDCATVNGQAATILADNFKTVLATDIISAQLQNAIYKPNISYIVAPAERTDFEEISLTLLLLRKLIIG